MNVNSINHSNQEAINTQHISKKSFWKNVKVFFIIICVFFCFSYLYHYFFKNITYQVVCNQLSDYNSIAIITQLEKMHIPYKYVADNNAISVPDNKTDIVRSMLSSEGLPKKNNDGFKLLDKEQFGASPFYNQINYQRALEGELTNSIEKMDQVKTADIHLAFPPTSYLSTIKQLPSASIVLSFKQNKYFNFNQFLSVQKIISASVPGLIAKNVVIVDQFGNNLNVHKKPYEHVQNSNFDIIKNLENYYYDRIVQILKPIFALKDFKVQVSILNNGKNNFDNKLFNMNCFNKKNFKNNYCFKLYKDHTINLINKKNFLSSLFYPKNKLNNKRKYCYNSLNDISITVLVNYTKNLNGDLVPLNPLQIQKIYDLIYGIICVAKYNNYTVKVVNMKFIDLHSAILYTNSVFTNLYQFFHKYVSYFFIFIAFIIFLKIFKKNELNSQNKENDMYSKYKKDMSSNDNSLKKLTDFKKDSKNIYQNYELMKLVKNITKNNPKLIAIIIRSWMKNKK